MEQITRRNGVIYYGEQQCVDIEDAYKRFRRDYHDGLGREVYKRLDRIGRREERIHGFGFIFDKSLDFGNDFSGCARVPYRMALVGMFYCRFIGIEDIQNVPEDRYEDWFDWAFSKGSGALRLVGRKDGSGRTSKRLKTKYR